MDFLINSSKILFKRKRISAIVFAISIIYGIIRLKDTPVLEHLIYLRINRSFQLNLISDNSAQIEGRNLQIHISSSKEKSLQFKNVTLVLILSYQRSGSSYLGFLLRSNPKAFYIYEPLDALYSSIYGTARGWNVPTDLNFYMNGSERVLPQEDVDAVSDYLSNLLHCRLYKIPTNFFYHPYVHSGSYLKCMRELINTTNCKEIAATLNGFCGRRYGQKSEVRMNTCKKLLENYENTDIKETVLTRDRSLFANYSLCLKRIRRKLFHKCSSLFYKSCNIKDIRSTKVVRGSMRSVELLLNREPNIKIIHLLRDPRGVALSRNRFNSSSVSGLYTVSEKKSNVSIVKEAIMFCSIATKDIILRKKLENLHPGKIITVVFDEFVLNIPKNIADLYRFLGHELEDSEHRQIVKAMTKQCEENYITDLIRPNDARKFSGDYKHNLFANSSSYTEHKCSSAMDISYKWVKELDYNVAERIYRGCKNFYDEVDFEFIR